MHSLSRPYLAYLIILALLYFSCVSSDNSLKISNLPTDARLSPVVQIGHFSAVTSVAFSPDGQYAVSGSADHTVKLWNVFSGKEIRAFHGHTDVVSAVTFIPGGQYVLTGGWDGTLRLWDVTTGEPVYSIQAHDEKILTVDVSPNGWHALSGSADHSIAVWQLRTGSKRKVLRGYRTTPERYAKDEASRITATGFADRDHGALAVHYRTKRRLSSQRHSRNIDGHIEPVSSAVFARNNRLILSGGMDSTIRLWDINEGHKRNVYTDPLTSILSVSLSPDRKFILCGASDHSARLLEMKTGRLMLILAGHDGPVSATAFSPDGKLMLTGGGSVLLLRDIQQNKAVHSFSGHASPVNTISFSPDGKHILSGHADGQILLWETATGLRVNTLKGSASAVNSMALLHAGRYLLTGNQDGSLKLWDTTTGRQERVYRGQRSPVRAVAASPDGRLAVSGNQAGRIALWDIYDGNRLAFYDVGQDPLTAVALSPDTGYVLAGTQKGTVMALERSSGKQLWRTGEDYPINRLVISPDGASFLCATEGKPFTLRDMNTGRTVRRFAGHLYGVKTLFFIDGGRSVVSGGGDQTLKLWNPQTGRLQLTFKGHTAAVTVGACSQDGRLLLSGGADQKLIVWDRVSGKPVKILAGHLDRLSGACFSPDGQYLYSSGRDATVRKWHLASGEELGRMHGAIGGEWITTTPDGYYANSPEGNHLVHWVMHGRLETYSYEQFESVFNKPEIVKARFQGRTENGKPAAKLSRPPVLTLPGHRSIVRTTAARFPLEIDLADHRIRNLRIFVNGKPEIDIIRSKDQSRQVIDIPLFPGANRITAIAYDGRGFSSTPQYLDVLCEQDELRKPDLHVVAIGVSDYPGLPEAWQLEFAHTDARALAATAHQFENKSYNQVYTTLLINRHATVARISAALEACTRVSRNDLVIIFLAGHGIRDDAGNFHFLTSDGTLHNPAQNSLNWSFMQDRLANIRGRVIVFLDACHSGALVTETVVPNNELAHQFFTEGRSGVLVFSASKGRQYSLESHDIGGGHGLFTYAILTAMGAEAGKVDRNRNGYIEFLELASYVTHYVDDLSGGQQTPWISRKELFGDLPLVQVN